MKQDIIQKLKEIIMELETDKPDPYAELKKAHAEGKVIQYRDDHMDAWVDCISPIWVNDTDATPNPRYRIKPEEPKPILTPEQIADGWIEWHGGENPVPGKRVAYLMRESDSSGAVILSNKLHWFHSNECSNADIIAYRVIEPKLVPLGPDDVPPGSVFRWPEWPRNEWKIIRELDNKCVYFCHGIGDTEKSTKASYILLKDEGAQINRSIPLTGKWDATAWEPCSKEGAE